ncbi:polymorphic toxin-type HINT domain-containing protein [Agarilytica rhodophyticola]|uniref:polymorphic toxin-type HINT domain-containing protein n=1 Tax=Agarilytica rhodophyticola TaxID=1737490 RepID=UPI003CCC19E4
MRRDTALLVVYNAPAITRLRYGGSAGNGLGVLSSLNNRPQVNHQALSTLSGDAVMDEVLTNKWFQDIPVLEGLITGLGDQASLFLPKQGGLNVNPFTHELLSELRVQDAKFFTFTDIGSLGFGAGLKSLQSFIVSLCFVEGTLVHTQDGLKPIEDINVGDLVASKNDITGETDWKRVSQLFINHDKTVFDVTVTTDDDQQEVLGATHEHPFWIEGKGWVKAGELVAGDRVHLRDGQLASISSIKAREGQHTTYNFEVEDFHTYFVGEQGVWVHNTCLPKGGFKSIEEFSSFGETLNSGLAKIGFSNVKALLQGSAVTGKSFRTGKAFDSGRVSDFDIALAGKDILAKAKSSGIKLRSGGTRTGPLSPSQVKKLGLSPLQSTLSNSAGRPVNFMIFGDRTSAAAKAPSIGF